MNRKLAIEDLGVWILLLAPARTMKDLHQAGTVKQSFHKEDGCIQTFFY
jgi:hypothetical protein